MGSATAVYDHRPMPVIPARARTLSRPEVFGEVKEGWVIPARARTLSKLALALGLLFVVTVVDQRVNWRRDDECGAFKIGVSAIGGCDGIGGKPSKAANVMWRMQHLVGKD